MRLHNATALAAIFTALSTHAMAQDADAGVETDAGADVEVSAPESTVDQENEATTPAAGKSERKAERAETKAQKASERTNRSDRRAVITEDGEVRNYGQVVSSLRADDADDEVSETEALTEATAETSVATVSVEDLENAAIENEETSVSTDPVADLEDAAIENADSLDQALAEEEEQITEIRDTIESNPDLTAVLEEDGYTVDDVVAVETSAEGEIIIVVDETS